MKYFSKHLSGVKESNESGDANDIIDIQVCCDAVIFKFLLDYCIELNEKGKATNKNASGASTSAKLTISQLFPVLVSSVFLQIDKLINECVKFWSQNFDKIMREEHIPVSQLETKIFSKLSEAVKLEKLLKIEQENQLKKI